MIYQIDRTIGWNQQRGNTPSTLKWELETSMLQEELDELKQATTDVDKLDAVLDLMFVSIGTLSKMGLNLRQMIDAYDAVVTANEQKSSIKNEAGKIIKPTGFQGPEPKLQKILDNVKE